MSGNWDMTCADGFGDAVCYNKNVLEKGACTLSDACNDSDS